MPPVFKKTKDYDPVHARKVLGGSQCTHSEPKRDREGLRMLKDLGFDEDLDPVSDSSDEWQQEDATDSRSKPAGLLLSARGSDGSGLISAVYNTTSSSRGTARKLADELQERTADCCTLLQQGGLDGDHTEKVQTLLLDLQHHVDLLSRGNASLRNSMRGLRASHREACCQPTDTDHLSHNAAVRMLESKLELALEKMQEMQHEREQFEHQLTIESGASSREVRVLRETIEQLELDLHDKEISLVRSQDRATQLSAKVAALTASSATGAAKLLTAESTVASMQKLLEQQGNTHGAAAAELAAIKATHAAGIAAVGEREKEVKQHLQEVQASLEEARGDANSKAEQMAALTQQLVAMQEQLESSRIHAGQLAQETEAATQALQQQLKEVEGAMEGLQHQLGNAVDKNQKLQASLEAVQADQDQAQQREHAKDESAAQLLAEIREVQAASTAAADRTSALQSELTDMKQQNQQLLALIADLQQLRSSQEECERELREAVGNTSCEKEGLQQLLLRMEGDLAAAQQEVGRLREELQQLREEADQHKAQLTASQHGESELAEQAASLTKQKAALTASLASSSLELQQLCEEADRHQAQLTESQRGESELAGQVASLTRQAAALTATLESSSQNAAGLTAEKAQLLQQVDNTKQQLEAVAAQLATSQRSQKEAEGQVEVLRKEREQLQTRVTQLQSEVQKAHKAAAAEAEQLKNLAQMADKRAAAAEQQAEARVAAAQHDAAAKVERYKLQWRQEFEERRRLHNLVVELKGNIRVLARIRPLLEKEQAVSGPEVLPPEALPVHATNEETLVMSGPSAGASDREYIFDRVFGPRDGQAEVFNEVSALVGSVLDGYNVTIMAYGQTGSGKTFTMEGPQDNPGVNTRALHEVFRLAQERSEGISCSFSSSVLEIYNEQIFDLLGGGKDSGDKLDVKEGTDGMFVPGLRIEPVGSFEEVVAVLQKGKQRRSTFATNMNEHSSRSHLVLSLYVAAHNLATGAAWRAKLHLIDLAGNERVSRSGAQGDRLKEAAAINKSLSALGDVVQALQQRSSHVPYRNSKLTRFLEDSLGGRSKTLMVVNCSPAGENLGETKCSLDFAARAGKVELGAAKKNIIPAPDQQGLTATAGSSRGSPCPGSPRSSLLRGTGGAESSKSSIGRRGL